MSVEFPKEQKNELLHSLLQRLAARGIGNRWAESNEPNSDLVRECQALVKNQVHKKSIRAYLLANPLIEQTVDTLLAYYATFSRIRWQDAPPLLQPLARQGWHFGRWLPTFLIIDGPLGRFLKSPKSPLSLILRTEYTVYPTITQARDIFNNDLFRRVRNGVGHWSFLWQFENGTEQIVMVDWESGEPTTKITLLEGEALHLVSFSIIEALDHEIFKKLE